ncbi:MAG TPA: hypothetical protein VMU85_16205 [Stellaceae bacterium]|nr:hypothetical protein [Stellaceae bacterium]
MLGFLEGLADCVLAVVATVVISNLVFALLKPVAARLSGSTQDYGEGHRSADGMLLVFPLLLLAIGLLSYAVVGWGFRIVALIAP